MHLGNGHWKRLLLLVVMGAVALSGCTFSGAYDLPLPGKVVSSGDGYQVTAEFQDVVSVVPRTLVMANDVPVGQVDSVSRDGWNAKVVMTIKKSIVLPRTATASVQQTSLLGEKYIALTAPTGSSVAKDGQLSNGAFIPLSSTTRDAEVEDVLGALSALLSGGGVAQLHTISVELNKAMDGRQADVRGALTQLNTFVGSLDAQKQDIIAAMASIDRLTTTLNNEKATIGAALDSFGPALQVLNQQHQGLVEMLAALDRLGKVGTNVIGQSKDNIIATLKDLGPTLKGLAGAGDSLVPGLMLMASFPFPPAAATLAKGDYSNALFAMNIDLNKLVTCALADCNTGVLPNVNTLCTSYAGACAPLVNALCALTNIGTLCPTNGNPALAGTTAGSSSSGTAATPAQKQATSPQPGASTAPTTPTGSPSPPAKPSAPSFFQKLFGGLL